MSPWLSSAFDEGVRMPIVMAILLFGGVALGFVWKRSLLSLLVVSAIVVFGLGVLIGEWSFLRSPPYFLEHIIYMTLTLTGYFGMVIAPMVLGAAGGHFLRRSLCTR